MWLDEDLDVAEVMVEHGGMRGGRLLRQSVPGSLHRGGIELRASERALERAAGPDHDTCPDRAGRGTDLLHRGDRHRAGCGRRGRGCWTRLPLVVTRGMRAGGAGEQIHRVRHYGEDG